MPQLLILTAFSILVYFFQGRIYAYKVSLNPSIFTLIGIALAIFLGFCNSASYDRYWEGRKLWGTLVVESRSLMRQADTMILHTADDETLTQEKHQFAKRIAGLGWSLNFFLRKKTSATELSRLLSASDVSTLKEKVFVPTAILVLLGQQIGRWHARGDIDSITAMALNERLNAMSGVIGGCERILNTPLPFTYHVLLHRTVYIYCFLLPFGLIDVVGGVMPLLVVFISYTFISLDAIVSEIGEPFGTEPNDLALNAICRTIEYTVFEQAGIVQPPWQQSDSIFVD